MQKQKIKLIAGIGLVVVAGYLIWKNSQKKKDDTTEKKNAMGSRSSMLAPTTCSGCNMRKNKGNEVCTSGYVYTGCSKCEGTCVEPANAPA